MNSKTSVPSLFPVATNTDTIDKVNQYTADKLTFTKNAAQFINCNYPEALNSSSYFGEKKLGNKYLNQVTVTSSTALLFVAYRAMVENFKIGVQIYNPNIAPITVTVQKLGKKSRSFVGDGSAWAGTHHDVYKQYVASSSQAPITIPAHGVAWIIELATSNNHIVGIESMLGFTGGKAVVTVYAYQNRSGIDGTATYIPNSLHKTFSGVGPAYYLNTNISFDVNSTKKWYDYTLFSCESKNINEMIPITYKPNLTTNISNTSSHDNVANWGAIYNLNINIKNTSGKDKEVKIYLSRESALKGSSLNVGLNYKLHTECGWLPNDGAAKRWKIFDFNVPTGGQIFNFQLMHLANGSARQHICFEII